MARPLRFVPANALVEITTRTIQGRLLLRPSPELTDIILGVIGKAQGLYGMAIHAFVLVSTHARCSVGASVLVSNWSSQLQPPSVGAERRCAVGADAR
jgi:hypothetical protein